MMAVMADNGCSTGRIIEHERLNGDVLYIDGTVRMNAK
jgi:hypothetical protein